jgi:hypothetical protein
MPFVWIVRHFIDRDRDREDEALILAGGYLDAVCVAQRKPVFRHVRDRRAVTPNRVLVVEHIALGNQSLSILDVNCKRVPKRRESCLANRGNCLPIAQDSHTVTQGQLLFTNRRHLFTSSPIFNWDPSRHNEQDSAIL